MSLVLVKVLKTYSGEKRFFLHQRAPSAKSKFKIFIHLLKFRRKSKFVNFGKVLTAFWERFNCFTDLIKFIWKSFWKLMEFLSQDFITWSIGFILISKLIILCVIWNVNWSCCRLKLICHNWRFVFWKRVFECFCKLLWILKSQKVKHDWTATKHITLQNFIHKSFQ